MSAPATGKGEEVYDGFDSDAWERRTDDAGPQDAERSAIAPRHLAGWLFADLFLVLFVLVLGLLPPAPPDRTHPPVYPAGPASSWPTIEKDCLAPSRRTVTRDPIPTTPGSGGGANSAVAWRVAQ